MQKPNSSRCGEIKTIDHMMAALSGHTEHIKLFNHFCNKYTNPDEAWKALQQELSETPKSEIPPLLRDYFGKEEEEAELPGQIEEQQQQIIPKDPTLRNILIALGLGLVSGCIIAIWLPFIPALSVGLGIGCLIFIFLTLNTL